MTSDLQKFTPRHFKILDMAIAGLQAKDIASKLQMSPAQVHNVIRSPSFQHQFAIRRKLSEERQDSDSIDEVKEVLSNNAKAAANKLVDGMASDDSKVVLKSATEILDRTGYTKKEDRHQSENVIQINISTDEATVIKESLEMIR